MYDYDLPDAGKYGNFNDRRSRLLKYAVAGLAVLGVILLVVFVVRFFGDANEPPKSAERPVTVAITGLDATEPLATDTAIEIRLSEPQRISRVEFFVDDAFAGVSYAQPFSFEFKVKAFTAGEHRLVAKAYDKKGKVYASKQVRFMVEPPIAEATDTPQATDVPGQPTTPIPPVTRKPSTSGGTNNSGGADNSGGNTADTTAPAAPAGLLLAADDGYTVKVSWAASSDNVGVTGYQVYRDGQVLGAATGTSYTDQTVVPGNTYAYAVRAQDAASNTSALSSQPTVALVPTSIWVAGDSPMAFGDDGSPLELGVKFKPLVDGHVSGVRFYKAPGASGTHTGRLWEANGTPKGTVVFGAETASGWQEATFATPIAVTAGTTYVVSYSTPDGKFGLSQTYFSAAGITSQYLTAPSSADAGNNGVFASGVGNFPNGSYNQTHYWVDALFIPNPAAGGPTPQALDTSKVYNGYPGSNNTGVPVGKRLPSRDRGMDVYEDGAIIENIEINGQVNIRAEDVTIRKSRVNSIIYLDTDVPDSVDWHVTIEDSHVKVTSALQRGVVTLGEFTIRRSNIQGGQMSTSCTRNCEVRDSWLHGQVMPDGVDWHLGGFLSNGGHDMEVVHNTLSCDTPNNADGGGCSGDLNLFGDFEAITNVVIDGNLLTANQDAGYCTFLGYNAFKTYGPGAQNVVFINNVFERGATGHCAGFGSNTDFQVGGIPAPGNVWYNNKYDDGTTVNPN
jgi:hypothetical protein